jgi:ribosome-associated protein
MIQITATISLRDDEIEEQFLRSPGPGGQKVDKTETAVQLRFNAGESPAISLEVLLRLEKLAGRRMTGDGVIIITASRHRTRERNRRDAVERLSELIRTASVPPKPRHPTKPTKGSKQRRLDSKQRNSAVKKWRSKVSLDD